MNTSAERDGPSDLDLRYLLGGGPGYRFVNRDDFNLTVRVGPAWVSENFNDESRDEDKASAALIWDMDRKLGDIFTLFAEGTFALSIESSDDALVRSETGVRAAVTRQIFLEGKVEWDWDSEPAEDAERQDVSYVFGVGYEF